MIAFEMKARKIFQDMLVNCKLNTEGHESRITHCTVGNNLEVAVCELVNVMSSDVAHALVYVFDAYEGIEATGHRFNIETKVPLTYKDYRKVDSTHVNRIVNATSIHIARSNLAIPGGDLQALCGIGTLANGHVLAEANSAPEEGYKLKLEYDRRRRELCDKIVLEAQDNVYDHENYRLCMNLNAIDEIIRNELNGDDRAARMIANGAMATSTYKATVLSTQGWKYDAAISTSNGELPETAIAIPHETYIKLKCLIGTYIEIG